MRYPPGKKRDDLRVVLDSGARVEIDGEVLYPKVEERLFISRQTVRRPSSDEKEIVCLEDV